MENRRLTEQFIPEHVPPHTVRVVVVGGDEGGFDATGIVWRRPGEG